MSGISSNYRFGYNPATKQPYEIAKEDPENVIEKLLENLSQVQTNKNYWFVRTTHFIKDDLSVQKFGTWESIVWAISKIVSRIFPCIGASLRRSIGAADLAKTSHSLAQLKEQIAQSGNDDLKKLFHQAVLGHNRFIKYVRQLVEIYDNCWDEKEQAYRGIEVNVEAVCDALSQNAKVFNREVDYQQNHGFIRKKDIKEGDRVFVRADLHGDLKSLLENLKELQTLGLLDKNFRCNEGVHLVFLGDYTDRGDHDFEVLHVLARLRLENPDNIHLIRGNHENPHINMRYTTSKQYHNLSKNKPEILNTFYETMPLTLYLGVENERDTGREYIQFTHGMFEIKHDPAELLDSDFQDIMMMVPKALQLSERINQIPVDSNENYEELLKNAQNKSEKRRIKQLLAAQKTQNLIKHENENRLLVDVISSYNWGDIKTDEGEPQLISLDMRYWKITRPYIKHYMRLSSTKHKVKMIFRGHQHEFAHLLDQKGNVLVTTLSVGMDCKPYGERYEQKDRSYILTAAPKVKNWKKVPLLRTNGKSTDEITEIQYSIRSATV